jgi:hypothetical protein
MKNHYKHSHNNHSSRSSHSKTITLGEWDTEIEAAQAYNIGALIMNGPNTQLNDVPTPSIKTFDDVISELKRQGWNASDSDMAEIKFIMTMKLGMKFLE